MTSLLSYVFGSRFAKAPPTFEEWTETTTQDQVYELFLHYLKNGDDSDNTSESISEEEVAHFEAAVCFITGTSTPSQEVGIPVSGVLAHLTNSHREVESLITSASGSLTTLLLAHASFPFPSPVALTSSSLLRAVTLLTLNSNEAFRTSSSLGREPCQRGRQDGERIAFIFAVLASPQSRPGSVDDILDVLCRLPCPRKPTKFGADELGRQELKRLLPMATRLNQETGGAQAGLVQNHRIPVESLRPLARLSSALNGNSGHTALGGSKDLGLKEFETWALKVGLVDALDGLFACFLRDEDEEESSEDDPDEGGSEEGSDEAED